MKDPELIKTIAQFKKRDVSKNTDGTLLYSVPVGEGKSRFVDLLGKDPLAKAYCLDLMEEFHINIHSHPQSPSMKCYVGLSVNNNKVQILKGNFEKNMQRGILLALVELIDQQPSCRD